MLHRAYTFFHISFLPLSSSPSTDVLLTLIFSFRVGRLSRAIQLCIKPNSQSKDKQYGSTTKSVSLAFNPHTPSSSLCLSVAHYRCQETNLSRATAAIGSFRSLDQRVDCLVNGPDMMVRTHTERCNQEFGILYHQHCVGYKPKHRDFLQAPIMFIWFCLYIAGTFTSSVFHNKACEADGAAIELLLLGAIANMGAAWFHWFDGRKLTLRAKFWHAHHDRFMALANPRRMKEVEVESNTVCTERIIFQFV